MLQVDHLDLNVGDLKKSVAFYDKLLGRLGLHKTLVSADVVGYADHTFALYLIPSDEELEYHPHRVGLNHLAFRAESREDVDALYRFVVEMGAQIIAKPKETLGKRGEGYYSFFFHDPNGIRLEYAYWPRP